MSVPFLRNKIIVAVASSIILFVIAYNAYNVASTFFIALLGNIQISAHHAAPQLLMKVLFAGCIAATPLLGTLLVLGLKLANAWKKIPGAAIIILCAEILFAAARILFIRTVYQNQHLTIGYELLRWEECMLIGGVIGFSVLAVNAIRFRAVSHKKMV